MDILNPLKKTSVFPERLVGLIDGSENVNASLSLNFMTVTCAFL